MQQDVGVPVAFAGIITMIIASGTILSSLASERVTRRFGAGVVTAVSVGMTAAAFVGFSVSESFWMLCLWAIPYGLGAGAVDAALNNYVALHYAARHMNWLHSFWGLGASISPFIMGYALTSGLGWSSAYRIVGLIQAVLTFVLLISLPLWGKVNPVIPRGHAVEPNDAQEAGSERSGGAAPTSRSRMRSGFPASSWASITGFVRVVGQPRAWERPLPVEGALAVVRSWLSRPCAWVPEPGPRHLDTLLGAQPSVRLVTDAHLAAIAIEHGLELLSRDRDFARWSESDLRSSDPLD